MDLVAVTLNLVCLLFCIFLILIYFTKKNMKNIENTFYKIIIICNFFMVLSELMFPIFAYCYPTNLALIGLSKRLVYFFLLNFFTFICAYVIIIALENNEKIITKLYQKKKLLFLGFSILSVILFIIEFNLPIKYAYNSNGIVSYAYGLATNDFTEIYSTIIIVIAIPFLITNWKKINKRKLIPLGIILLLEGIAVGVNLFVPTLCLASFSITMTSYLMFHTIENPDLKLITELELAKNQAEHASNAKSDFLSSMSHELRTPLNAIVGLSDLIKNSTQEEETRSDADDIYKASNNLLELVDGILDINKLDSNKMEMVEEDYSPRALFDSIVKLTKFRLGDKPIELRTNFSDQLPDTLFGDKDKIKNIINNLLTNAVKYTDQGYIDFNVDCIMNQDKCSLRITISDTGRGIKEDQMQNLFTRFYRLEEDRNSDILGTGLGLALTKLLVEFLDGKITVDSTYGVGTTFLVTIPEKISKKEEKTNNNLELL